MWVRQCDVEWSRIGRVGLERVLSAECWVQRWGEVIHSVVCCWHETSRPPPRHTAPRSLTFASTTTTTTASSLHFTRFRYSDSILQPYPGYSLPATPHSPLLVLMFMPLPLPLHLTLCLCHPLLLAAAPLLLPLYSHSIILIIFSPGLFSPNKRRSQIL